MNRTPEESRAARDLNVAVARARENSDISADKGRLMAAEIDRLRAEVRDLREWEKHWHQLNALYLDLERENVTLKCEAAAVRGAIEQLAVGAGRPPHWHDHFVVMGPPREDGEMPTRHAVPWEWAQPPFQLVREQMDAMQDYGTRASNALHEVSLLRPDAERWAWISRQREVQITRHYITGCTLRHVVDPLGRYWDTAKVTLHEGKTAEECVDKARAAGEAVP